MVDFIERPKSFLSAEGAKYVINEDFGGGANYVREGRERNNKFIATVFVEEPIRHRMQKEGFSIQDVGATMKLVEVSLDGSFTEINNLEDAKDFGCLAVMSTNSRKKTVYPVSLQPESSMNFMYALLIRKDGNFFFSTRIDEVSSHPYKTTLRAQSRLSDMK